MVKAMVRQVVPLQPMEINGGADIHLQPMEDLMPEQVDTPKGGCNPMESPCWSRLLAEPVTLWERPTLEQFTKNCSPWEGPTLEKFVEDCLPWEGPNARSRLGVSLLMDSCFSWLCGLGSVKKVGVQLNPSEEKQGL
ncbi:AN1-type zinc finger protein 5-like [Grus japonensis]|uniref:AN1-type zinc finger protein 5-like n=1 Tax=Grus japonensis TaxID=30415 RepID=A0ABC9Y9I7_GRUJA